MATQVDVAKFLEISPRQVQRLVAEGHLPKAKTGAYDLATMSKAYYLFKFGDEDSLDVTQERALLHKSQRERVDLEIEVKRGRLVETQKAEEAWSRIVMSIRAKLLALPAKLAPLISPSEPEIAKAILEEGIYETLYELSEIALDDTGDDQGEPSTVSATAQTNH